MKDIKAAGLLLTILFFHGCSSDDSADGPCDRVTCQNGGTCNDGLCECPDGFEGLLCETEIISCEDTSCQNGGTCSDGSCDCPLGTYGDFCENVYDLELRTAFGSIETLNVAVDEIFAIWWSPEFDHEGDVATMFQYLNQVRQDCIELYGMEDPPNPPAGYYYNVYIHHGQDETALPDFWGNGQGTDSNGMPFLTLPDGAHIDYANLSHEGFHIFQYAANSEGFAYAGDSQWYIEASAQWYMSQNVPDHVNTFIEAGAISSNPHVALWHSFSNEASGDPRDWLFQVRQYGMHTLLYYLNTEASMDPEIITSGFYANTVLSPQEYIYTNFGGENLRNHFADWTAHNTAEFDYISREQYERALLEVEFVADPDNLNPFVHEVSDDEVNGTFSPEDALTPRGWSYNVIKINNSENATYSFNLTGVAEGSEGGQAHFEARIIVMSPDTETRYIDINMEDALTGSGSVEVSGSETEVYLNIVAVPEHFGGNQTYDYEVTISRN